MTPSIEAQIIYESAMYHLIMAREIEDLKLQLLHEECEREHLLKRMHWVKYGR